MRILALIASAIVFAALPVPAHAGSSVITSFDTLRSAAFPAVLVLPDGARVTRSTLRRLARDFSLTDVLVYDLDTGRSVRRLQSSLGDELLRANVPLGRMSVYDIERLAYHQPRGNELVGGTLTQPKFVAITTDRAFLSRTRPLSELDSDLDGLSDLVETGTSVYVSTSDTGSSPVASDSDGDGISDGDEVFLVGSDPNVSDSDSDGLSDLEEWTIYGTSPLLADSDDDGLDDGDELFIYGTRPLEPDTDGGGRSDGEEALVDGTDPLDETDDVVVQAVPGLSAWGLTTLIWALCLGAGIALRRGRADGP